MQHRLPFAFLALLIACGGDAFQSTSESSAGGAAGQTDGQGGSSGSSGQNSGAGGIEQGGSAQGGESAAGQAGDSGSAGSAGQGGATAGNAGDGGAAGDGGGQAGDGGSAGSDAGGTSGSGGVAGEGGDGGAGGNAGAAGEAGAAQAGNGGDAGQAGAAGQPTCNEGEFLCNQSCVTSTPEHCGADCAICTTPDDHAIPTCEKNACGKTCAPGFALAAGRCRDFGGWYVTYKDNINKTQCSSGNNLNGNQCICPNGFNKVEIGHIPQDGTPFGTADSVTLSICVPASIVGNLTNPAGDWGGAYVRVPSTGGCLSGNPYRSDKACGCPIQGSWQQEQIPLKENGVSNDLELTTCRRDQPQGSPTFYGTFARFKDSKVKGGSAADNCYSPFPGNNKCMCPDQTIPLTIESKYFGSGESGISLTYPTLVTACVPQGL